MRHFSKEEITKIKQSIQQKKQSFPEEWLGRALAYTPYQPRPLCESLKKHKNSNIKNLYSLSQSLLTKEQATFLQTAKHYEQQANGFFIESLEHLTYLRRYVCIPLIYDFLIADSYQLLESLVYGADGIVFYPQFLTQKELKDLSDYALKIGLERIFCVESKEDLTKAIFAKADLLNLNGNFSLLSMIPKNKIILSQPPTTHNEEKYLQALDAKILNL